MEVVTECLAICQMYFTKLSWGKFRSNLTRKKVIDKNVDSKLARVLTTLDLTALGVGSTLGVGVYVLAGDVAKTTAGPAVTISFFIAAVASILAGLCYAEFGARVPKAGSAYVYSYVCVGEFFAFVIGWNLILEYLIGSATVTKALFLYLDELSNKVMSGYFTENMPMSGSEFGSYVDVFSLGLAITFAVAIAFGAKESSLINNIFTVINLCVVTVVIISGLWKVDKDNWNRSRSDCPHEKGYDCGNGGFAPFGIKGVIKGAARCFFGFIGFDCIATAGEEAKTPHKSIPIAVVTSLLIVFLAYFGMSTILTMMLPYFEQNTTAPLPHVYDVVNWKALKYVVSIGALCGLFSSLLGAMFPLPRIIYAMASDGLLFKVLAKVHPKFQTPFMGTLIAGAITGILACLFQLSTLTHMMSIGTLLAYSMVAACVLILRFNVDEADKKFEEKRVYTAHDYFRQLFKRKTPHPTRLTSVLVSGMVFVYFCLAFVFSGLTAIFETQLANAEAWIIAVLVYLLCMLILLLVCISFQPVSSTKLSFSVPCVPWIPGFSILINVYLMTTLPTETWTYYAYWMAVGLFIYFAYGFWNSTESNKHEAGDKKAQSVNEQTNEQINEQIEGDK